MLCHIKNYYKQTGATHCWGRGIADALETKPSTVAAQGEKALGRNFHHWVWWEACQVSKEFQRLYGMPFLWLTLPSTALLFGWNFDTLGKFSSSHNSLFPSLNIWSKESLCFKLGALRLYSLWCPPWLRLPASFLAIIAYFLLPSCSVFRRELREKQKIYLSTRLY